MFDKQLGKMMGQGNVAVFLSAYAPSKDREAQPVVIITMRERWFRYRTYIVDSISFLLVCERLLKYERVTQPFIYNETHGLTPTKIEIPIWAINDVQTRCAEVGPIVYNVLKNVHVGIEAQFQFMRDKGVLESEINKMRVGVVSPLTRYKELHAQVNKYVLK